MKKYKPMEKYPKVKTLQMNEKLIIVDGQSPLRYVDLRTNIVHIYEEKEPPFAVKISKGVTYINGAKVTVDDSRITDE